MGSTELNRGKVPIVLARFSLDVLTPRTLLSYFPYFLSIHRYVTIDDNSPFLMAFFPGCAVRDVVPSDSPSLKPSDSSLLVLIEA